MFSCVEFQVPIPLYEILKLDEKAMTVRVEPMVTIGDITEYLIPRGYSLAVTIELVDATLGGKIHIHKLGKALLNLETNSNVFSS